MKSLDAHGCQVGYDLNFRGEGSDIPFDDLNSILFPFYALLC